MFEEKRKSSYKPYRKYKNAVAVATAAGHGAEWNDTVEGKGVRNQNGVSFEISQLLPSPCLLRYTHTHKPPWGETCVCRKVEYYICNINTLATGLVYTHSLAPPHRIRPSANTHRFWRLYLSRSNENIAQYQLNDCT